MKLKLVQLDLWAANEYIRQHHRHLGPTKHYRFSVGAQRDGKLIGVAVVAYPLGTTKWNRTRCQVNRLATDGTPNACSFLLGAAAKAAKALGYFRIYTYTLPEEGGASLRASGWVLDGETAGASTSWETSRCVVGQHLPTWAEA